MPGWLRPCRHDCMDLRAGRLAEHSRHPVDSESCVVGGLDVVVRNGVTKPDLGVSARNTLATLRVVYVPFLRN